jgi:GDPmannose 4,6-dehydratase
MQKTAIIVWVHGQDGRILYELLQENSWKVIGVSRSGNIYSWDEGDHISLTNTSKKDDVFSLVQKYLPDQLYYFPAYHHSSQDILPENDILWERSHETHVDGYFHFLQAIVDIWLGTNICYASSCLIYEGSDSSIQDESTVPEPRSIYAATKLSWMHLSSVFRAQHGLSIVDAIFYNHESEYRDKKFLFMKVIEGAIQIKNWNINSIEIWNIDKRIDWWYARDYMKMIYLLLEKSASGKFIISSGETHSIRELLETVFSILWLNWQTYTVDNATTIYRNHWILFWSNKKLLSEINYTSLLFDAFIHKIISYKLLEINPTICK